MDTVDNCVIYNEKLRILKGWLNLLIILSGLAVIVFGIWYCSTEGGTDGTIVLVAMILLGLMLLALGAAVKIEIEVTATELKVGYIKRLTIRPEEIESCELIDRKKIFKMYYGFGIRFGRNSIGFTVNQTDGVLVKTKGRKNVVICSDYPEQLKSAIDHLSKTEQK